MKWTHFKELFSIILPENVLVNVKKYIVCLFAGFYIYFFLYIYILWGIFKCHLVFKNSQEICGLQSYL